jgi:hypothetical protein
VLRRPLAAALAAVFAAAALVAPRLASAWTDARVRRVSAHVEIAPDASTIVTLVSELHVAGGWLQSFELDGLDPALELLPDRPPSFEDATTGVALAPAVEHAGDGRIVFTFRRRHAPRRGNYVATVCYRGRASVEPQPDGALRVTWTLPSWRYGLDDVSITIDAPAGAVPERDEIDDGAVRMTRIDLSEGGERFVLRRAHLPRMREWPVALRIPAERMDPALRERRAAIAPPAPPSPSAASAPAPAHPFGPLAIALLLAACAIGRIATIAHAEREARLHPTALVPLGAGVRAATALALAVGAGLIGARGGSAFFLAGLGGIALLALHRPADAPRAPRFGSFRPASADDIAAARRALRLSRLAPLDASTPPGAALLALIAAAPVVAWVHGALPVPLPVATLAAALAGAILIAGHVKTRPAAPLADLARLLELAARARADLDDDRRWMLRPVLHVDVRGRAQEARLRIVLSSTPQGLVRLDVVHARRRERTRWSARPVLLAVTREGSPADHALEQRFPGAQIAVAPRRVARAFPLDGAELAATLAPVLEALAACPAGSPDGSAARIEAERVRLAAAAG